MITEDYVSFEIAKLLKEKGFTANIHGMYDHDGKFCESTFTDVEPYYCCYAPTLQMAMKWLRDVHKLGVFPTTYYRHLGKDNDIHDYGSTIVNLNTFEIIGDETPPINGSTYTFEADTYEETAEKAIKYCLENLI